MRNKLLCAVLALLACASGVDAKWIIASPWQCTVIGTTTVCVYVPIFSPDCGKNRIYCR
jgi:hypothetical protein